MHELVGMFWDGCVWMGLEHTWCLRCSLLLVVEVESGFCRLTSVLLLCVGSAAASVGLWTHPAGVGSPVRLGGCAVGGGAALSGWVATDGGGERWGSPCVCRVRWYGVGSCV